MEKYKNKYRIQSTRLQNWDYGWNGAYFVTICTKNRECYFGDIADGKMQLSEIGEMANKYWLEIPQHFSFVKLNSFVVMPNHIHGIIVIDKINVETQNFAPLLQKQTLPSTPKNRFGPQSKNLASIIRGFKIGVTKNARLYEKAQYKAQDIAPLPFKWQSRFYDHIIRNEKSFNKISEYIINNPENWEKDKFYDK